jgi:1,4-dihydroxy-2-naphthoate octaprenyltransferase
LRCGVRYGQALAPSVWRKIMLDVAMLAVGCVFLIAAVLYTVGCDRI